MKTKPRHHGHSIIGISTHRIRRIKKAFAHIHNLSPAANNLPSLQETHRSRPVFQNRSNVRHGPKTLVYGIGCTASHILYSSHAPPPRACSAVRTSMGPPYPVRKATRLAEATSLSSSMSMPAHDIG
jgi:hypothetical protein